MLVTIHKRSYTNPGFLSLALSWQRKRSTVRHGQTFLIATFLLAVAISASLLPLYAYASTHTTAALLGHRSSADWPLPSHDVGHTNYQPYGKVDLNRLSILWMYNFSVFGEIFHPIAYDLDGDHLLEVVACRTDRTPNGDVVHTLYCFSSQGLLLWIFRSRGISTEPVGITHLRSAAISLMIHNYGNDTYYLLDPSGNIHSTIPVAERLGLHPKGYIVGTPLPYQANASDELQIVGIAASRKHCYVFCFSYPEQRVRWMCYANGYPAMWSEDLFIPTLADVDDDSVYEVVTASAHQGSASTNSKHVGSWIDAIRVFCIDNNGLVLWNTTLPYQGPDSLARGIRCCSDDADSRSTRFAYIIGKYVYLLNAQGNLLWEVNLSYSISQTAAADFDQDGIYELVLSDGYRIFLLDDSGQVKWRFLLPRSYKLRDLVLANFDEDQRPEVLALAFKITYRSDYSLEYNNTLYCIDSDSSLLWTYTLPNTDELATSLIIADLNQDGLLEIIVSTTKRLYCLSKPLYISSFALALSSCITIAVVVSTYRLLVIEDGTALTEKLR